MGFFERRKIRKRARSALHHARHCRHMREDVASAAQLAALAEAETRLKAALRGNSPDALETATEDIFDRMGDVMPPKPRAGLRENIEVIVVAVAVAMAFRTYFIQPFKIPTGSMQPTLYGITTVTDDQPGVMDRMPLKCLKWAATGEWYSDVRAKAGGTVSEIVPSAYNPAVVFCYIAGKKHKVPIDAARRGDLRVMPGMYVQAGARIWAGHWKAGDHVFVDKMRWNFAAPRRGQIIVFSTQGIPLLPEGTHYIKRLIGLPGETVGLMPPDVLIDGKPERGPSGLRRIAERQPGYDGYQFADPRAGAAFLGKPGDAFRLGAGEYFAMGDNTGNSKDGRYWGAVPRENMLGPAAIVYWPFTKRWGIPR